MSERTLRQHPLETTAINLSRMAAAVSDLPVPARLRDCLQAAVHQQTQAYTEGALKMCVHVGRGAEAWCHVTQPELLQCEDCFGAVADLRGGCRVCANPLELLDAGNAAMFLAGRYTLVAPVCRDCNASHGAAR